MNGIAILMVLSAPGIDYGWRPGPDGQLEYIIQLEPAALEALKNGTELTSDIHPDAKGVQRFVLRVGKGPVPRELPPARAGGGTAPPASPPSATSLPAGDKPDHGWPGAGTSGASNVAPTTPPSTAPPTVTLPTGDVGSRFSIGDDSGSGAIDTKPPTRPPLESADPRVASGASALPTWRGNPAVKGDTSSGHSFQEKADTGLPAERAGGADGPATEPPRLLERPAPRDGGSRFSNDPSVRPPEDIAPVAGGTETRRTGFADGGALPTSQDAPPAYPSSAGTGDAKDQGSPSALYPDPDADAASQDDGSSGTSWWKELLLFASLGINVVAVVVARQYYARYQTLVKEVQAG
jgi:hypothetical protein